MQTARALQIPSTLTPWPERRGIVLIVEDDPAVLGLTESILKRQGFEVLSARDSAEALCLWRQHRSRIQLLLTGETLGLGRRLQTEKSTLRVVYTSGYCADMLDGNEGLPEDWVFIYKPFDAAEWIREVRHSRK